ncbi:nose resistant to fluoxetine protein 6-like [Dermacentor silvarum]|uniref:nose resistant to fluoxetine protein 6-like n=1 Tax=Dermacentor silvarum TaxID=543639 RepID=UPI002100B733|nr:nose resistant to fluoxetine protein 6-like [Dermacentor silvarum]
MKLEWSRSDERGTETNRMFVAFIDRILWSVCLAWFSFACITGRGGIVNGFLSWKGFVPLARLSFGVYLIHVPFYHVMHRISRERRFYSHFTLVSNCFVVLIWSYILSYILSIACEVPTAHLEKLVFVRDHRKDNAAKEERRKQHHADNEDAKDIPAIAIHSGTSKIYPPRHELP